MHVRARAPAHAPIVPLMLSSTSLIIWNSSSSVGFCPMAAGGGGAQVKRKAPRAEEPRHPQCEHLPAAHARTPPERASRTFHHEPQLPHVNRAAAVLVELHERVAARVDLTARELGEPLYRCFM